MVILKQEFIPKMSDCYKIIIAKINAQVSDSYTLAILSLYSRYTLAIDEKQNHRFVNLTNLLFFISSEEPSNNNNSNNNDSSKKNDWLNNDHTFVAQTYNSKLILYNSIFLNSQEYTLSFFAEEIISG